MQELAAARDSDELCLLGCANGMPPRHRDALLHGLLDAACVLEPT